MKRFMMLVGVAVVAAAMYVAAGTASRQSTGPTAKQFKALKAQVATLGKKLKSTRAEADAAVGFIATCLVSTNAGLVPVSQFGDPNGTVGYRFDADGAGSGLDTFTSALDYDGSTTPAALLQAVDPVCLQSALRHRVSHAGSGRLQRLGERFH